MNLPLPTEAQEGEVLVAYLRIHNFRFTHTANESNSGRRDAMIRGGKMKRQGVSRGFPDYTIIVGGHLLFIELKRRKGGTVSPEQKAWIEALNEVHNVQAFVARGADEAIAIIEKYAANPRRDFSSVQASIGTVKKVLDEPDTLF